MTINVAIADRDPVTRLAGLALRDDPAQAPFLDDYFSSEGPAAATIRALAARMADLDFHVHERVDA